MTKLMISEKASVTKDIAKAMKWKDIGGGVVHGKLEGEDIYVVSASGHLVEYKKPQLVNPNLDWNNPGSLLPLMDNREMVVKADMDKKQEAFQPRNVLKRFRNVYKQKKVDEIIIATDADREGEAIGWEIVEFLGHKGKIRRAWFSAGVDPKSLKEAINNLRHYNDTMSWWRSAEARGLSDRHYIFLTMAYTHYAGYGKFGHSLSQGKGRSGVVSVGRVQTPTVAMIVKRELEIKNFIQRDHFKLSGLFGDSGIEGTYIPNVTEDVIARKPEGVHWEPANKVTKEGDPEPLDKPLFIDERKVEEFSQRLKANGNKAIVKKYTESEKKANPPKTFDLPAAQGAVSRATGVSAKIAQTIMEDLYEQGYLSYARTSKSDIPLNYHEEPRFSEMLDAVSQLPSTAEAAKRAKAIHHGKDPVYNQKFTPSVYSKSDMEHHGIVPTPEVMTPNAFKNLAPKKGKGYTGDHMRKAYELTVKQYIQSMYPPAIYATQEIQIELPVEDLLGDSVTTFRLRSERIKVKGWLEAFDTKKSESSLPKMQEGDVCELVDTIIKSARTTPPKRYTEGNITKAMSNVGKDVADPVLRKRLAGSDGIGTPATRSQILDTIKDRGYVRVEKEQYYATQRGIDLIEAVPVEMSDPATTALWEDVLIKITMSKDDAKSCKIRDDFINRQRVNVESLIQSMMDKFDANLGERVQKTPTTVSKKMEQAIRSIAKALDISIPKGTLSDPVLASKFISEHAGNISTEPSEAQINFARKIEAAVDGVEITDEMLKSKRLLSKFIEENKDKVVTEPTEKMKGLLTKLIENDKTGHNVNQDAFINFEICKQEIDKLNSLNIRPPTEGQIKFVNQIAEVATEKQKPKSDVFEDSKKASEYIEKYKNLLNKSGSKGGTGKRSGKSKYSKAKKK